MFIRIAAPVAIVFLLGYGLIEAYPLLAGPSVSLATPQAGAFLPNGVVTVSGRALRVQNLTLDGAPLLPDESGAFSATFSLPPGDDILTLSATDRFGRARTLTRTVVVPVMPVASSSTATTTTNS